MNEWRGGRVILDGQSGVLILGEGGQFTFIVYDTYILYMYIYTGYLWGKKITVFHNLNLCIYTGCPKKSGNDHTSRAKQWRPL